MTIKTSNAKSLLLALTALTLLGTGLTACSSSPARLDAPGSNIVQVGRSEVNGFQAQGVTVRETTFLGRQAVVVELTDEVQQRMLRGAAGFGNGPTYAITDQVFTDGTIEVDVAGEINGKGAPDVRGFVGLAFHLSPAADTYEAVYLRMSNGTLNVPSPPAPPQRARCAVCGASRFPLQHLTRKVSRALRSRSAGRGRVLRHRVLRARGQRL